MQDLVLKADCSGHQMQTSLNLRVIDGLTEGKLGTYDVACPFCGPSKSKPASQRKRVLRIWRLEPSFATFHCVRCGEKGYVRDTTAKVIDLAAVQRAKTEAAEREAAREAKQLRAARRLWGQRLPIRGSIAETYLRGARGYHGPLPATLGFLQARENYEPAMIAAFGLADEPEPGLLGVADHAVRGVHLTRLASDGSGKAGGDTEKIILGKCLGLPIVVAHPNDLLGLAIAEGIEDALSVHEATGLGAWVAGSASRLPALASAMPTYIETVRIIMDDDPDGRRYANELAAILSERDIDVRLVLLRAPLPRRVA
jgi:hypothetical protein